MKAQDSLETLAECLQYFYKQCGITLKIQDSTVLVEIILLGVIMRLLIRGFDSYWDSDKLVSVETRWDTAKWDHMLRNLSLKSFHHNRAHWTKVLLWSLMTWMPSSGTLGRGRELTPENSSLISTHDLWHMMSCH